MGGPAVPRVLVISGSDSGGGAGMQADIKSCSANGAFSTSAITALTAQNTLGVRDVVGDQMSVVFRERANGLEETPEYLLAPLFENGFGTQVHGVLPIAPAFVIAQMDAVLDDVGADCAKTGMLATRDAVDAIAARLKQAVADGLPSA